MVAGSPALDDRATIIISFYKPSIKLQSTAFLAQSTMVFENAKIIYARAC